jgi:hypothetical protein
VGPKVYYCSYYFSMKADADTYAFTSKVEAQKRADDLNTKWADYHDPARIRNITPWKVKALELKGDQ